MMCAGEYEGPSRVTSGQISSATSSPSSPLLKGRDEERWPVAQQQTVVVMTRTYSEQQANQWKKIAFSLFCFVLLALWLAFLLIYI